MGYCSYSTVKFVTIDDKRLATLHYLFQLCIFLYIVVYQIIGNLGYADSSEPVGSLRLSIQPPMKKGDPNKDPDYEYDFPDLTALEYCAQNENASAVSVLPCKYFGEIGSVFPVTGTSPFFLSTRIQESNQTLVCREPRNGKACKQTYAFSCRPDGKPCYSKDRAEQEKFFLAGIEDFTLMIDHAAQSPVDPSLSGDVSRMKGFLKGCKHPDQRIMPMKTPGGQDFFPISQLLSTVEVTKGDGKNQCGTSLDELSSVYKSEDSNRYEGAVIIITIEYSNSKNWKGISETIEYTYSVAILNGAKSKVMEGISTTYPDKRIIQNRHGIVFTVQQQGSLKSFSLITMLTKLTTSLALLAMATTVVDALMSYCLKHKKVYLKMKYSEVKVTEDEHGSLNYRALDEGEGSI
eukprot:g10639.t1